MGKELNGKARFTWIQTLKGRTRSVARDKSPSESFGESVSLKVLISGGRKKVTRGGARCFRKLAQERDNEVSEKSAKVKGGSERCEPNGRM